MISTAEHAAAIPNPELFTRQRARRTTRDTPRFLRSYDETLDGDLILRTAATTDRTHRVPGTHLPDYISAYRAMAKL